MSQVDHVVNSDSMPIHVSQLMSQVDHVVNSDSMPIHDANTKQKDNSLRIVQRSKMAVGSFTEAHGRRDRTLTHSCAYDVLLRPESC